MEDDIQMQKAQGYEWRGVDVTPAKVFSWRGLAFWGRKQAVTPPEKVAWPVSEGKFR